MFFAGSMGPPPIHADEGAGRGGAYVYYGNDTRYLIAPKVGPGSRYRMEVSTLPPGLTPRSLNDGIVV